MRNFVKNAINIYSMKVLVILFSLALSFCVNAQLPSKVQKLEGVWKYNQGSGYEVWKSNGETEMLGTAYRVNPKTGDSSKVESLWIRRTNRNLIYSMETFKMKADTVVSEMHDFVGGKRKMKFYNIDSRKPYLVAYSFGFLGLNKKKLTIKVYYEEGEKPLKLRLTKQ